MKRFIILFLLFTAFVNGASFDCKKASTKIEKAICSDSDLSNLDSKLGDTYRELKVKIAQNRLSKANAKKLRHFFIKTQRKWVKNRNKWCNKYDSDELKSCLDDHYSHRIQKLRGFSSDGSFIYANYTNVLYNYNHVPYMQNSFKEILDKKEYAKFLKEYSRWEKSYGVCVDKYGVMQEKCVVKVAKRKTAHYEKLLESYKNSKYLVEDANVTLVKRSTKSYLKSYEDSDEASCLSFKYYPRSEYKKLFHKDINNISSIPEMKFEDINSSQKLQPCNIDEYRFHAQKSENIIYISKNVVVIMHDEYGYFGGAHGDYESSYYTLDRDSAKIISWQDIFGMEQKLYDFVMKKMRYIVTYTEYFKESDYYNMAGSHFYITKDGIVVKFGVYEITTYDQGEPSFLISHKLLKKTLSKEKYEYYFGGKGSVELKAIYKPKN